jgi:hypothetical protein
MDCTGGSIGPRERAHVALCLRMPGRAFLHGVVLCVCPHTHTMTIRYVTARCTMSCTLTVRYGTAFSISWTGAERRRYVA